MEHENGKSFSAAKIVASKMGGSKISFNFGFDFKFEKTLKDKSIITVDEDPVNEDPVNEDPVNEENEGFFNQSIQNNWIDIQPYNPVLFDDFNTGEDEHQNPFIGETDAPTGLDEVMQNSAGTSKRYNDNTIRILEAIYDGGNNPHPSKLQKSRIQELTSLSRKQVTKWFNNKRNKK